jgi:CheY-like chemotaxis protein
VSESDASDPRLSVLIVDSDERVSGSLAGLLEIGQRCAVVACAASPAAALDLLATHRPDVVLLDPRLPDLDAGRALVIEIRRQLPTTRVVIVGVSEMLDEATFGDTADAYVRKTFRPKELLGAIATAVGSSPVGQSTGQSMPSQPVTDRSQPW